MNTGDPVPRRTRSSRPRPAIPAEVSNLGPSQETFEARIDRLSAPRDGAADGSRRVLAGVLDQPGAHELVGLSFALLLGRRVDQAQLERLFVPVGRRPLEAADVVAPRLDPELPLLGFDVDPEAGRG